MDKPIKIREATWKKLTKLKYTLEVKSIDEVIKALLKLVTKFKLANELEQVKKKTIKEDKGDTHSSPQDSNASPAFFHHVKQTDSEAGSNDNEEDEE